MKPKFLALAYDDQILNDILDSNLKLDDIILYIPQPLLTETSINLQKFCKVVAIDNYLPERMPSNSNTIDQKEVFNNDPVVSLALQEFEKNPFAAIIAHHEVDLLRAAWLRDLWSLPGQSFKSAYAFRCKTTMKEILKQHGIAVPAFQKIKLSQDITDFICMHSLPVVIKPDFGTGSHGITILRHQEEVEHYLSHKWPHEKSIGLEIETYVEGIMYQVNGFYKSDTEGYFWPSVYPQQSICMTEGKFASSYTLGMNNPLISRLNTYAQDVLSILPTPPNAVFHLEVFITPLNEIVFCEIASRIGGKGVRGSWKECFDIPLGNLCVQGQIGAGFEEPVSTNGVKKRMSLYQQTLCGEIWFPVQEGQLKHMEDHCPFPWVQEYHTFYKTGDIISTQAQNINDCLCGVSLLTADTEEEMKKRLHKVAQWVYDTTQWAPL